MNIKSLRDMFNNHKNAEEDSANYLSAGQLFPEHIMKNEGANSSVVCCVSLYCKVCIDLLPDLNELNGNFTLITDGSQEDIREIQNAFNYKFPVISVDHDDFHELIQNTPCILFIDENNKIQELREINTYEEVRAFIKERR
ncbi:TlpA family protein disulfide reductase [Niallia taxi]|uniref:TlpA family protein disulfide reductase n=1 Tax=Niallia taxi TaxID=2499688 RepID=UPI003009D3F7